MLRLSPNRYSFIHVFCYFSKVRNIHQMMTINNGLAVSTMCRGVDIKPETIRDIIERVSDAVFSVHVIGCWKEACEVELTISFIYLSFKRRVCHIFSLNSLKFFWADWTIEDMIFLVIEVDTGKTVIASF